MPSPSPHRQRGQTLWLGMGASTGTGDTALTPEHHHEISHQHGDCIAHMGSRFVTPVPVEGKLALVPFPEAPASAEVKQNLGFPPPKFSSI